jgi:ribosomal protein S15P/S13E
MTKIYTYDEFTQQAKDDRIDVFISCSSFEERCLVIPRLAVKFNAKYRVVFYNINEVSAIRTNAQKLFELGAENTELIKLNSDDPIQNYLKIIRLFDQIATKYPDKPNIVIDTTTFTHETLLVLLRILHLRISDLGQISVCYVGAKEYSTNMKDESNKWLSKGVDEIRTILGYPGFTDPTKENHLIILFGFEFERTKKIIEEYEFDIITLGFGDEPIQNNHMRINYERHQRLLKEHPEAREFKFSLRDPINTKAQLLKYVKSKELIGLNTVIAPLNNKLSTIGAGLAAIANEDIQLAYAKATIYNTAGYSTPNEDIYYCKIDFNIE